jgi:hypothetical protein
MSEKTKTNPALAASVQSSLSASSPASKPASRRRRAPAGKSALAAKPVAPAAAKPAAAVKPAVRPENKPAAATVAKPVAKPAAKPATKPAAAQVPPAVAKPVVKTAPATALTVANPVPVAEEAAASVHKKKGEGKKAKVIRDTFTIPVAEYQQLAVLKQRAQVPGGKVKKSELLRAGLVVLSALSVSQLQKVLLELEPVKTGRPSKK